MTQQQQGRIWNARLIMRRLIQEIRTHSTYPIHGIRNGYRTEFDRKWKSYRADMADGYAK